ncbi:MAG: hypothetical protein WC274_08920, partial [Sulfurimonas sp.]
MLSTINWDKLQPYSGDTKKSFEELCYQIVSEQFKDDILNGAILTSIDDSGGGDGVEFYLTYKNGDVYGWQAKYFCRLNEGGRKEQIKKSLQTTYDKHPNIKKWFLCSKCNFTTDEKKWFDNELTTSTKKGRIVLPAGHNVELVHWGESELLTYLKDYSNIYKFFFSEKLLTQEWFENRYKTDSKRAQIKAKYISEIHIQTEIDITICKLLGNRKLADILHDEIKSHRLLDDQKYFKNAYLNLFSKNTSVVYKNLIIEFKKNIDIDEKVVDKCIDQFFKLIYLIKTQDEQNIKKEINILKIYINIARELLDNCMKFITSDIYLKAVQKEKKTEKVNLFEELEFFLKGAVDSLEWCLDVFDLLDQNELHISGEAGMGKTHVSFNIYENQTINQKEPAIFILAKDIYTDQSLENQLKDNLSIPVDWIFDDFLGALEISARVHKVRIPIIIDGLNESTHWNSVWKNGLEKLILKLKQYPHIVLITTYRSSYEDQLFPKDYFKYDDKWRQRASVPGFEGLDWKAIETYFKFYKIKLENHSNAIGYFKHPLHLKIFCETKNRSRDKEVKVSFQNE